MLPTDVQPTARVVVGFDGSDPALRALDQAAEEALRREATLEIVCGWPWGLHMPGTGAAPREQGQRPVEERRPDEGQMLYDAGRAVTDAAVERIRSRYPDLRTVPHLTTEPAARAILRAGRHASMTVVGTRGLGGFAGLLLGSVSLRVAAHRTGPLLVVRGGTGEPKGVVLVGLASEEDSEAVRFGFLEARRRGAALKVLHAWRYPSVPGVLPVAELYWEGTDQQRKCEAAVPAFATAVLREEYPDVEVRTESVYEGAGRALVEASAEADVVVLATRRPRHPLGLQLGPVTHAVLHHAHCPVTLIPTA
ncbi:universal stress protein [Streptomyces hesseae]|uniref:Universal stress protein n=1 Tax=Streptomyces hesseae TaxID=3075519 RepID=A0ABU2SKJ0_9ACTN|nr:universal stress protein [Streptomyces sp. DSM 40473]MDT0449499.1 universal stress protein [Streptomyces sp. DSM 40473]